MYKTIGDRKRKWVGFLSGAGEKTMYIIETEEAAERANKRPLPWPGLINERIEWAYEAYNQKLAQAEWLPDDSLPVLSPYTGTEIFAEAFGCRVSYPGNDMPFALPKYRSSAEAASMKVPEVHDTPLGSLFEIARRLRQKAGPDAILQLPDIQSPLDIAALILEKEAFYIAMSEEPQVIRELTAKTKALLTAFLDEWFKEFGASYAAHFPAYYMEGGVTLSEDEIGAFSPDMFNEYVLGALNEMSERYGGIGIHCCAFSERQWPNLLNVKGLRLLNLVRDSRFIRRSLSYFGDAAAHWPMELSPASASGPDWFSACPDGVRVVLTYKAEDRAEALGLSAAAEDICAGRRERAGV